MPRPGDVRSATGLREEHEPDPEPDQGFLSAPFSQFAAQLAGESNITADVRLPAKNQLTVQLVNVALLHQLDEQRGDESIFQNAFYAVLGGEIGLLVPLLSGLQSGATVDNVVVTIAVVFGLLLIGLGFFWRRTARRVAETKRSLFATAVEQ